jgi:zinc-ribbon domain
MKSLTGQYECLHHSGVGLDYFTSRIDRLTLQANGRCLLINQEQSRISHAARSLLSGQQVDANAPEARREGRYVPQGNTISFIFDDGSQEQGQIAANGIQVGSDFFEKVSDSTLLPPTHRMKSNMEDIAKGLKIAGAIGGATIKAVKTIQDSLQSQQGSPPAPASPDSTPGAAHQSQASPYSSPASPAPPPAQPAQPVTSTPAATPEQDVETLFCDQCGAPVRPGKRFCNRCGARLP